MPTLTFLLYLLAVFGAWFFKLSYLGWFGPFLLSAVIVVPLFLLLLCLPSMLEMKVRAELSPYVTRDNEGRLRFVFETKRRLPLCRVKVLVETENRFAGEIYRERRLFRDPGCGTASLPLHTELCGQLSCRILSCECRDLLGIFALRKKLPERLKCTVMPPVREPDTPVDIDAALETVVNLKPKYGGGFSEDHDLREYRPGDTVNSIHWKLSSKMDDVIIREPLVQENSKVFLVLSRVGAKDRGLEVLYWLSLELCRREIPHIVVANDLYPVSNESEAAEALSGILAAGIVEPRRFDPSRARCIFRISEGEVRTR